MPILFHLPCICISCGNFITSDANVRHFALFVAQTLPTQRTARAAHSFSQAAARRKKQRRSQDGGAHFSSPRAWIRPCMSAAKLVASSTRSICIDAIPRGYASILCCQATNILRPHTHCWTAFSCCYHNGRAPIRILPATTSGVPTKNLYSRSCLGRYVIEDDQVLFSSQHGSHAHEIRE